MRLVSHPAGRYTRAVERVPLGNSGLTVTRLCLGTMQFGWTADEANSFAVLDAYADAGGNFLDTADIYSRWVDGHRGGESEAIIGRWLRSRGNRHQFVVATKVRGQMWDGPDGEGLGRAHITRAVEDSLRRLQLETVDLYQCHWFDDATPIEETLRAFEDLLRAGKVRAIGVSNFPPPHLVASWEAAARHALTPFTTLQPHHSLVHRKEWEDELQALCIDRDMGVIPYSPLAAGFLTGKYRRGGERVQSARAGAASQYFTDEGWAVLDLVVQVAAAHATTPAAVALAWQLAQPGVTAPIVGANSPAQLAEQLPALTLSLGEEELAQLDEVSQPFRRSGQSHPGR